MSPSKPLYAAKTAVPADRSRNEIERLLERYGATSFAYGRDGSRAVVMFKASDRHVRFSLALPTQDDPQEERRLWRCLVLAIKAKLEVVASGIETFEEAFLAHIVLPDNQVVGDWLRPQVAAAYELGTMPALMPGGS